MIRLVYMLSMLGLLHVSTHAKGVRRDTASGAVEGFRKEVLGGKFVDIFRGIPYAKPPTGELRFEPPQPTSWNGVLKTKSHGPMCPQYRGDLSYVQLHRPGFNLSSEDCLFLNIYAPERKSKRRLRAVLVYVHGGSNELGTAAMFEGDVLATIGDIVVVTLNYRLAALGFLGDGKEGFRGNFGLLDQLEAFRWVQKNIQSFGGDPRKVTIDGHSSGSTDVGLHMISPLAKDLFRYSICQSGDMLADWAILSSSLDPVKYINTFTSVIGCDFTKMDSADGKECLKQLPLEDLINTPIFPPPTMTRFFPIVDQYYIFSDPTKQIEDGMNVEAHMIGVTKDEGTTIVEVVLDYHNMTSDMMDAERLEQILKQNRHDLFGFNINLDLLLHEYTYWKDPSNATATLNLFSQMMSDVIYVDSMMRTIQLLTNKSLPVYMYTFEYRSSLDTSPEWFGVPHGKDLFYLFGCPLVGHPLHNYSAQDPKMSILVMRVWSNFVKYGIPGIYADISDKTSQYAPYTYTDQSYFRFVDEDGANLRKDKRFRPRQVAFWNDLVPMFSIEKNEEQYPLHYAVLTWIFMAISTILLIIVIVLVVVLIRRCSSKTLN